MSETFGQRVKKLREMKGMSQMDVCKRLGYKTRSTLCAIENGTNKVTFDRIGPLARVLDTTPEYLIYGNVNHNSTVILHMDDGRTITKDLTSDQARSLLALIESFKE